MTRGESNNNPCNIRISNIAWLGKVAPNTDGSFEQFDVAENGIRTGAKLLSNYYRLYGLQTVTQIISRYAPATENATDAYIADVANRIGVGANDDLDMLSGTVLAQLVTAIIWHENGEQPYDGAMILDACNEALSLSPPIS